MVTVPPEIDVRNLYIPDYRMRFSEYDVEKILQNKASRMRAMLQGKYLGFIINGRDEDTFTLDHWAYITIYGKMGRFI